MEIGIGLDTRLGLSTAQLRDLAPAARALGYGSMWTPAALSYDPVELCIAWHARSGLATGVSVVPIARNPASVLGLAALRIADAWRVTVSLGTFDSGMEMGDDAAAKLVLPDKAILVDYAARAFAAAQHAFTEVREDDLELRGKDLYDREGTVAAMLVGHLQHLNRHLGMIEALAGVMGESGTASV